MHVKVPSLGGRPPAIGPCKLLMAALAIHLLELTSLSWAAPANHVPSNALAVGQQSLQRLNAFTKC